jgi:hypothetical protein
MRLFATSCISYINNRGMALDFDREYGNLSRKLEAHILASKLPMTSCGRIETLFLMAVFDPGLPGKDSVEVGNYSKKEKIQGVYVSFNIETFAKIPLELWPSTICSGIIAGFEAMQRKVKGEEAIGVGIFVEELRKFFAKEFPSVEISSPLPVREPAPEQKMLRVEIDATNFSFDEVVSIEALLASQLSSDSEVDGHDIGQGVFNIFIVSGSPRKTKKEITKILDAASLKGKYSIASE